MTSTLKLQSPAYDNAGLGESFLLPGAVLTENMSSQATIHSLPGDVRIVGDFAQNQEVLTIIGFLTVRAATEAGFANPTHFRDGILRTRSVWPGEDGAAAGVDWNNPSLPAGEGDTKTRARGKARLIRDKSWNAISQQFVNLFFYGTVLTFQFGPVPAATLRDRIPYALTFIAADVRVGE